VHTSPLSCRRLTTRNLHDIRSDTKNVFGKLKNATQVFSCGTEFLLGNTYLDNKINVLNSSLIEKQTATNKIQKLCEFLITTSNIPHFPISVHSLYCFSSQHGRL
jgi:hypothetical protein